MSSPAGYSGTPLPKKLGVAAGGRVLLVAAPDGFGLAPLPAGAQVYRQDGAAPGSLAPGVGGDPVGGDPGGGGPVSGGSGGGDPGEPYDVVVAFCPDRAAVAGSVAGLARRITPRGALWICWPKRSSGVRTDLTENVVREVGLRAGLVDVKVAAVDATWSGLKFVYRLADRPR